MNRRKFIAALTLLPTIPFLGWTKAHAEPSLKLYSGMTKEAEFKVNARLFILHIKDAMEELRFKLANTENLQLFKTWLDITIAKITPNCFSCVNYVASYNEESNLEVLVMIGAKSKAIPIHKLRETPLYHITLRIEHARVEQYGII